jgi:rfaE bifunctional protein nucleotidyltransferase chain/domain
LGQILSLDAGLAWRQAERAAGRAVVLTNGHFDLLHVGHVRYLQAARALGEALVIGLNSDASTAARKPGRPIVPQEERGELLAALGCVDAVVIFDAPTAEELVAALRPDIYVKGGDWNRPGGPRPPEAAVVEGYGGRVVYLPYLPDRSTSRLIERIQALRNADRGLRIDSSESAVP